MFGQIPFCCFSFGGGVQSSAIYLMLIHEPWRLLEAMKELPDKVFFADTGAETQSTYTALKYMQNFKSKSFEIEIVGNGNLLERKYANGDYRPAYPFFIRQQDGKVGMSRRECTRDHKVYAVQKACRQAFGLVHKPLKQPTVSTWLGISTDEIERVKSSEGEGFITRYPLIELGWDRGKCIEYCNSWDWQPTKSRCFMCPYQSDVHWQDLKWNSPEEFELACQEDERIRHTLKNHTSDKNQNGNENNLAYLHRSCVPLREVIFSDKGDRGQDLFADECQGMCAT